MNIARCEDLPAPEDDLPHVGSGAAAASEAQGAKTAAHALRFAAAKDGELTCGYRIANEHMVRFHLIVQRKHGESNDYTIDYNRYVALGDRPTFRAFVREWEGDSDSGRRRR